MSEVEPMVISVWTSMASWFTPTLLFCVVNLMIAIIFIASSNSKAHKKQHHHVEDNSQVLVRSSSFLERTVKAINVSLHHPFPPPEIQSPIIPTQDEEEPKAGLDHCESRQENSLPRQLLRTPSLLERLRSFNFSLHKTQQPDPFPPETHYTDPPTHEEEEGDPEKMKKWVSEKGTVETVRERKGKGAETASFGEEEGVDAKADDFIHRFRQQLKLQRVNSILRYKDMLSRGSTAD